MKTLDDLQAAASIVLSGQSIPFGWRSSPKPFMTGSMAYGIPHEDSDVDVVVLVMNSDDQAAVRREFKEQREAAARGKSRYAERFDFYALRYGDLNLLCCFDMIRYYAWVTGTLELVLRGKVTKKEACATFDRILKDLRINEGE